MKKALLLLAVAAASPPLAAAQPAAKSVAPAAKPAAKSVAPAAKPAARAPLLPAREWEMIRQTAVNYGLTDEQTWLLAAIRRHENGRAGLEFGVGGPMDSGHKAHRYRDGVKSFYVQAAWAAGTVRRHYTGDLAAFGRRYNPPGAAKWARCVGSLVTRLKAENGDRLPGAKPARREFDFLKQ